MMYKEDGAEAKVRLQTSLQVLHVINLRRAYDDNLIQAAKLEEFLFGGKDASRKDASSLFARQDNVQGIPQVCVLCSHTNLQGHGSLDTLKILLHSFSFKCLGCFIR